MSPRSSIAQRVPPNVRTAVGLLFSVAFGVGSVVMALSDREATQPIRGGVVTDGIVQTVSDSRSIATATIDFVDQSRRSHTFDGPGEIFSSVSEGDHVRVSYLPTDPSVAHDLSAHPRWPLTLSFGGLVLLGAGLRIVSTVTSRPGRTGNGTTGGGGRHAAEVQPDRSVDGARFSVVRLRESYGIADVDAFLDKVEAGLVTSADVNAIRFKPVRLGWSYDMREVDDYLAALERSLNPSAR